MYDLRESKNTCTWKNVLVKMYSCMLFVFFSDLVYMYLIRMLNIIKRKHVNRPIFHFFSPWRKMLLETKCLLFSYMYLTWFGTLGLCSEIIVYWMEWDCVSLNLFDLTLFYQWSIQIFCLFFFIFVEFRYFFLWRSIQF